MASPAEMRPNQIATSSIGMASISSGAVVRRRSPTSSSTTQTASSSATAQPGATRPLDANHGRISRWTTKPSHQGTPPDRVVAL
jgi:hypothetical protein